MEKFGLVQNEFQFKTFARPDFEPQLIFDFFALFQLLSQAIFPVYKNPLFSQKLGAALGNAGRNHRYHGEYADFDIPLRSQVYVQTPGDHVFVNTFPIVSQNQISTWPNNTENYAMHVYIRMYGGNALTTNLVPLHNYDRSDHVHGYHCYILLPNDSVVHAYLQPGIHTISLQRSTCVFVRMPGGSNRTYSGVLEPLDGYFRPSWLPHASSIPRPRN